MEQRLYEMVNWFISSLTHTVPESDTRKEYRSKQVMIASSTTQREESGKLFPTSTEPLGNKLNKFEYARGQVGAEKI